MHKLALLFPGQGSQYVGMGKDFYQQFSIAKEVFEEANDVLQLDLTRLLFEGPQDLLVQTKHSQVAIYVMSYAVYRVVTHLYPSLIPYVTAGLSLGEYTALASSRRVSFAEGLRVVAQRGALMQEACLLAPGSMQVVLGLSEQVIEKTLAGTSVCIANLNCPGQVVIAGPLDGLERVAAPLKEAGAKRILPLEVSGAFHSPCMQSAREGLSPLLSELPLLRDTSIRFVMNTPGDFVEDLESIRAYLIRQVTEPVRWQKGIEAMAKEGVTHFLELGCGKTLQGMNKRIGVQGVSHSVDKIEDIAELETKEEWKDVFA